MTTELWRVYVIVAKPDVEAIRMAAPRVVPGERHGVITELLPGGEEGWTELALDVEGASYEDAVARATRIYERIRIAAGLSAGGEADVGGVRSPVFRDISSQMYEEAMALLEQGRTELAVVRLQTALELVAKDAMAGAFRGTLHDAGSAEYRKRAELVTKHCSATMLDTRTQNLIHALTGQLVTAQAWWPEYLKHVRRRNLILHEGAYITEDDGRASVAAVEACIGWLRSLWTGELVD
jgi:hypothetical protein